jgi:predicted secreted protein
MSGQRESGQDPVNDEQTIRADAGAEFEVTVADLPGAGYEWVARDVPAGLAAVGADWAEPAPDLVGGSRRHTFRFRAERSGSYQLVLELCRHWEHDRPPARTSTIRVEVSAPADPG